MQLAFNQRLANHMDSGPANCTPAGMLAADPANRKATMPHAAFDKQPANHMDSEPANCTPAGMLAADPANH